MILTELPTREPDFKIGEGMTYPAIASTLKEDGAAVNLTGATVTFSMMNRHGTTVIDSAAATVVSASDGQVSYTFQAAQTAEPGIYYAHWEVDFGSSSIGQWPSDPTNYIVIEIIDTIE